MEKKYTHNFNISVKNNFHIDKIIEKEIRDRFNFIKKFLEKHEFISVLKYGDYALNVLYLSDNIIYDKNKYLNLDIAIVDFNPNRIEKLNMKSNLEKIFEKIPKSFRFKFSKVFIPYLTFNLKFNNIKFKVKFNLRIITKDRNKFETIIFDKGNVGIKNTEHGLQIIKDYKKANKISNGILVSILRIQNFIFDEEINYNFHIYQLILTRFYEYLSSKLNNYFIERKNFNFNSNKFMTISNLSRWFKNNIDYKNIIAYIISTMYIDENDYFNIDEWDHYEILDDVNRYSQKNLKEFKIPRFYFNNIFIEKFNTEFERSQFMNNPNISKIAFDKSKEIDSKFLVSPMLKFCTSVDKPNLINFFTHVAKMLWKKMPSDLMTEINSFKRKEAMMFLSNIQYEWLLKYRNKLNYLLPYFDNKYPFYRTYNDFELIELIKNTIINIKEEEWIYDINY